MDYGWFDYLTPHIQGEVPWCMFADDILLIDELQEELTLS